MNGHACRLLAIALYLAACQSSAEVIVDPSITLTRQNVSIPRDGRANFSYRLAEGTDLVFTVGFAKWRGGPLRIWLLDDENYRRMDTGQEFDYLEPGSGLARRRAQFVFNVPRTGVYHIVLDNSQGRIGRHLDVYAYARTLELSAEEERIKRVYEGFYAEMNALLHFEDFDIVIPRCGRPNAFAARNIVICRELEEQLADSAMSGVQLFVFMHEVAHQLLRAWGYRSTYRHQLTADRFAATLMELMDREEEAAQAAEWFASSNLTVEGSSRAASFTMSRHRARKIAGWLEALEETDRGWTRRVIVPRMRTPALVEMVDAEQLQDKTLERIELELERRAEAEAL